MYTTHGLMGPADLADYRHDTDTGTTWITLDDPPDWLDTDAACPICGEVIGGHDAVTVTDAGGNVIECVPHDPTPTDRNP